MDRADSLRDERSHFFIRIPRPRGCKCLMVAQETAGQASADLAEVVRGEPFVAAMRLDGKPVEAPCDYTEYTLLKWAAELERFLPEQNVLGSKCPYDGAFRVRAGCAERTYERTIVQVDRAGDTGAARLALVRAKQPATRWDRVPGRPVPIVLDLRLVRGPDDADGETMAVPDSHGPLARSRATTALWTIPRCRPGISAPQRRLSHATSPG